MCSSDLHVVVVVAQDVPERRRRTPAQEVEVAPGDLPAVDVLGPGQAQHLALDRPETSVGHAMPEDTPDEGQKVQVAAVRRRVATGHPVAGDEQGPVERPAVVGDQPRPRRDLPGKLVEEGGFECVVGQEELYLPEARTLPPAEPDEEREAYRILFPAYGTYVGNAAAQVLPWNSTLLYAGAVIPGHILGRWRARHVAEERHELEIVPMESDAP